MSAASPPEPGVSVPELGPLLGRLTHLRDREASHPSLGVLRIQMVTTILEFSAKARRMHEEGKPYEEVRAVLGRDVWLAAFRETAEQAAGACLHQADERLAAARRQSRMPWRRFRSRLPTDGDRHIVVVRARAAGIPLERSTDPATVPAGQWHEALRHTAGALEESWERLDGALAEEVDRWTMAARDVAAWRRPPERFWITLVAVALLALTLGLSLGGYLPAPGPLGGLRTWWWSLPWP